MIVEYTYISPTELLRFVIFVCYPRGPHVATGTWPPSLDIRVFVSSNNIAYRVTVKIRNVHTLHYMNVYSTFSAAPCLCYYL